jgi:anaerobic selenocysteine-containing dehydrogenase/Fe-S-cluster-containing dehydrogenase component
MAGAGALPADVAWRRHSGRWISYVTERMHVRPGLWTIFATTCRECPAGCGLHVRTREGRVVKPEGNPNHPINQGGLCPRGQSAPQGLYDPDRLHQPLRRKPTGADSSTNAAANPPSTIRNPQRMEPPVEPTPVPLEQFASISLESGFERASWSQANEEVAQALKKAKRLLLLSDLQTGALAEVMQQFHRAVGLPGQVAFYEAFAYEPLRTANESLFGRGVIPRYRLSDADLILSLGAEFLESWISNVEFAWQFVQMHHRPPEYGGEMIYIGPRLSLTAASADDFLQIPAGQENAVARALLEEVKGLRGPPGRQGPPGESEAAVRPAGPSRPVAGVSPEAIGTVARKLAAAQNPVVLAGPVGATGPAAERLATTAMQLNQAMGAIGRTVDFSQTHALGQTIPVSQFETMARGLGAGDVLIVHQTNPAYSLPHLQDALRRAEHLVFIGSMMNETATMARWVLPTLTPLQEWGDYEPWTGLHCLMQPTMGSMYDTKHSGDVFLSLARSFGKPLEKDGQTPDSFLDWLRLRWRQLHRQVAPDTEFDVFWRQALQRGGLFENETKGKQETSPIGPMSPIGPIPEQGQATEVTAQSPEAMHLWLWPSILWFDGRLANRGWMQEIPERMSTLTWGSWVDISPATARRLRVEQGQVLEVSNAVGRVRAPARVTGDVADNVAALALGQGHTALGRVAAGRGANGFELLGPNNSGALFGTVELRRTGARAPLISLSATQSQWGRDIVRWISRRQLRTMKESEAEEITWPGPAGYDPHRDLYPPHDYPKHRWAMVVDLDRCIGCGACSVACYAENNVPVMGPRLLSDGREMAWLRVIPYRHADDPRRTGFLVLPCQQCDAAPCEPVCPVFAAVHNDQGLNAQIYNRCVGTRYCSNNCPYKVRRFEWFDPHWRAPLHLQLNPDVTVRCRGVMEKCTFCIQRIQYHERLARIAGRPLRRDEIQPACVQSCPTRTYVFGDLMRPDSEVYQLFHDRRRYQLLRELNTKPAVIYLKRILADEPQDAPQG